MRPNKINFSVSFLLRITAKMRLYLAVAVLVLAFVAYAEAQDTDINEKFATFGRQVSEMSRDLAEKAKTTFDDISNSQFAVTTKSWFHEQMEKLKSKFQ